MRSPIVMQIESVRVVSEAELLKRTEDEIIGDGITVIDFAPVAAPRKLVLYWKAEWCE